MDININRCVEKYWHKDIDTQVGNENSLEVQNKQDNDIDKQKVNIFPPHIEIQNHILRLKHYNDFMKNVSFEFNYFFVCNEKAFMQNLIICNISYLNIKMRKKIIFYLKWILNIIYQITMRWFHYNQHFYNMLMIRMLHFHPSKNVLKVYSPFPPTSLFMNCILATSSTHSIIVLSLNFIFS